MNGLGAFIQIYPKDFKKQGMYLVKLILSNRTFTSIICDCYIREYYNPGQSRFFEQHGDPHDPDPFDLDMWIDLQH